MGKKHYCRLCLGQCANLLWVFDQRFEVNNHLKDLIYKTTGVEISQTDAISQKICHKCGENVVKLYEFRQQSQKNDQFLKDQLKTQKRTPHRSILNIFQKYPRILIPDLEICLSENISPVVEMRMDEVENHFKSKKLDFQQHVLQVLRQERQKQRAINAALKSKSSINAFKETVSPISIKYRQDKSSYEIVNKNEEKHSNNSLTPLGNHRKRQLSDSEQSSSSKKSPIKNISSELTPIPNRRQSIGPIEFNIRPGPSDLDSTLLAALEVSENETLSITPSKRTPEIISNILIRPADQSVLYHNVDNDTSNNKPNTAINIVTNDVCSKICDNNYLRINTNNSIEQIHPKPGVIDHLEFLKKNLLTESTNNIPKPSLLSPVANRPHHTNETLAPKISWPHILPSCKVVTNLNLATTVTRPHQHKNEHLVPNIPVQPHILPNGPVVKQSLSVPNLNLLSPTGTRPQHYTNSNLVSNSIPVNPHILPNGTIIVPNLDLLPPTVTRPQYHANVNFVPNGIPVKPHILPKDTIVKQSVPNLNLLPPTVTRPQHHTNANLEPNDIPVNTHILPKGTVLVKRALPNSNFITSTTPNTSNTEPINIVAHQCIRNTVLPEIVSNLDKNDKRLFLQTATDISLVPNAIPELSVPSTSKPVEATKDPYIFEVDEYLNPIEEVKFSKFSKHQKSNIESQSNTTFTKDFVSKQTISKEFTCNFCRESFTTEEMRQMHLETCKIKKEIEIPVYVLLEKIEDNVDIKKKYPKVFRDFAKTDSKDVIEVLSETETPTIKVENCLENLTPRVEIKNSKFPNINYTSKTIDVLKSLLASDKNESPVDQNSQTDLSSESPELDKVLSKWKMFPKKDSIRPQTNSFSLDCLKSFIHLYKIPVSINYKKCFDVDYNFEEPPKRTKTFDDWDDLTVIDVVKSPPSTPIVKDIPNISDLAPAVSAGTLIIPVDNISQNDAGNPTTSQNITPNSSMVEKINELREFVIINQPTETLPDLGYLDIFANDGVNAETSRPSSGDSNQPYQNVPQTNYLVQQQQDSMYQQIVTDIQPNVISTTNYPKTYPTTAGERINGLETNYFENYMGNQQPHLSNPQRFRSNKTWYPVEQSQQNTALYKDPRGHPPPYTIHHYPSPEQRHFQKPPPPPYNFSYYNNPKLVNTYYTYEQNSNQNVNIQSRSNYYNQNVVPDVSNVVDNVNYNCHVTDNNCNGGIQIDNAIIQTTSDTVNNASTIRVRPLSDLK